MNKCLTFGIILTTYTGDFHLTRGLLASIHYFAPKIPICIIQDGDFSLKKEKQTYNITHIIKKKDVKNSFLRENCFGSRCTNMIAFWESPFDSFLYLDSDTVFWGSILQELKANYDFTHNLPHEPYSEYVYKTQYCDFERLFKEMPPFNYLSCHFFNAGVFIAKRGIFELDVFKKLFFLWKDDRTLMPAEPQGMINYMVFYAKEKNHLRVSENYLQEVVPVLNNHYLKNKYQIINGTPKVIQNTIIHWAGTKPLLIHRKATYIEPMLFFRKQHLINIKSIWRFLPIPYLFWEEYQVVLKRYHQGSMLIYLKKKVKKILFN